MPEPQQTCATDKEIFDVLMGAKQRFTESALLDFAKKRGIFYSGRDDRDTLASNISLLPHSFQSLMAILDQRETASRAERVTHVTLSEAVDMERIRQVALGYQADAQPGDEVQCLPQGQNGFTVSVHYSEIDYSKNRLIQRREKDADIEFIVEGGQTTIRMPANEKAKAVVEELRSRLDQGQPTKIPAASISLSELPDPDKRSEFFKSLISEMPGFRLVTVTNIRVQSNAVSNDPTDLEQDDHAAEQREMLTVVESVALKGQGLHTSSEFQDLTARGFYISSIQWRAEQINAPHHLVEFEAGFEDPRTCDVFRYNVRGMALKKGDNHLKTFKTPERSDRMTWLGIIENTAQTVLNQVRESAVEDAEESEDGE